MGDFLFVTIELCSVGSKSRAWEKSRYYSIAKAILKKKK